MNTVIVVAFDKKYFDLGCDLIRSIKVHKELDKFDIAVLDLGLDNKQKRELDKNGIYIKTATWNIDFPGRKHFNEKEPGFKGMVARPFLPEYFPEYDNILWLDADTWVQFPDAIVLMNKMLSAYDCCAVPEIDRSYEKFTTNPSAWVAEYKSYLESFDEETANFLKFRPQINTGVIALKKDCIHWSLWQKYLDHGLQSGGNCRTVEQHAFNVALYTHNLEIARFPSTCNWIMSNAPPYYCCSDNTFVAPNPPFTKISILHLTSMTIGKVGELCVIDQDGNKLYTTNLLRPEYRYWEHKVHASKHTRYSASDHS